MSRRTRNSASLSAVAHRGRRLVAAEFEYDIRRIWLDGTPEDRAVLTHSHPDVVEHDSRITAYEEQLCTE